MDIKQFVAKWKEIELSEIAVAQSHFIDVCSLVGHPAPTDADPKGEFFTFEMKAEKPHGEYGRADAWYKGKFIWEYKRPGSDLDKAYDQLLLYRESLGNPPLLITSDIHSIIIHTNFTNTAKKTYRIDFALLIDGNGFDLLKQAFYHPEVLKPEQTQEEVTKATADTFIQVANSIQQWEGRDIGVLRSERLSHFIIRLLFSLFAQDMGLLPDGLFTKMVETYKRGTTAELSDFTSSLRHLFVTMRDGGFFGFYRINHFNGGLFDDDFVPDLPTSILYSLRRACLQNWASIDPSIFGTLFERIIDESKRSQLGLHYTSKEDISLIVEPVIMDPLRKQWTIIKQKVRACLHDNNKEQASLQLKGFSDHLGTIRILDPACGSGNFLYVSLQQLLDLQKEVITFAVQSGLP
ncbi:MAG: type IIL restriction-modification enzyme MmeI, partial [Candidatus Bathyarchaeota archaeon]